MTTLIICRHGNTFNPDQTPTRIGRRTDLPLVESGLKQAEALGMAFAEKGFFPNIIYTSNLKRTQQMADRMMEVIHAACPVERLTCFDEIDYGPDENKTEDAVIERIGQDAIDAWNNDAVPPTGWEVNPDQIKQDWLSFSESIATDFPDQVVMVVTSNGVGRFAPYITGDYEAFRRQHDIKLKTGAYAIFEYDGSSWQCMEWNVRPN